MSNAARPRREKAGKGGGWKSQRIRIINSSQVQGCKIILGCKFLVHHHPVSTGKEDWQGGLLLGWPIGRLSCTFFYSSIWAGVKRNYAGQKDSNIASGRKVWTGLWVTFEPVPVGFSHRNIWCSWRNKPHYTAESKSYVLVTWAAACHLASVWDHGLGCDGFASAM